MNKTITIKGAMSNLDLITEEYDLDIQSSETWKDGTAEYVFEGSEKYAQSIEIYIAHMEMAVMVNR